MEQETPSYAALKLREWRDGRGLSQAAAGALLGLSSSRVSDIEHGRRTPGLRLAVRIQRVTGIEPSGWTSRERIGPILSAA